MDPQFEEESIQKTPQIREKRLQNRAKVTPKRPKTKLKTKKKQDGVFKVTQELPGVDFSGYLLVRCDQLGHQNRAKT